MRVQGGALRFLPRQRSYGRKPAKRPPRKQTRGLRLYRVSDHMGASPQKGPPQKQTKGLRPYRFAVGAAMAAGQSLSHAAHDSSLCTKEPWKNGAPICSLCKGAFFKPPLFAKGEVARSAGRDKPGVSLFQSGETRIYCARHCRTAFSLGHVLLCTLPAVKPRPPPLACISAF